MRELTEMELDAVCGGWSRRKKIEIDIDIKQRNSISGDNYGGVNQQSNVANVGSFNSF